MIAKRIVEKTEAINYSCTRGHINALSIHTSKKSSRASKEIADTAKSEEIAKREQKKGDNKDSDPYYINKNRDSDER